MAAPITEIVSVLEDVESGSEADSEYSNTSDDVDGNSSDHNEDDHQTKKGLADVFSKILHKAVPIDKQVILAKGKTDREILKRKLAAAEEEGEGADGKEKKEYTGHDVKRKIWENMSRSKPDPLDREKERRLQKIATRGVVQLFNAVKKQQKTVEDEIQQVGGSERKRDKVMAGMTRDRFLNILQGTGKTQHNTQNAKKVKTEDNQASEKKWSALRDDFMMGARMKDWDREESGEEGVGPADPDMSDNT
ncbi:RRP15-like protein [Mya arenaria]|uniref:RRP15-like protein n=1 Tax=Mya arenaria TaxID=6604 RepID=A0ABY7FCB4_MYAAR|nr:RRP15-like protein [Mya arenaria]